MKHDHCALLTYSIFLLLCSVYSLEIYLCSLCNILHPTKFLSVGCGRDKDGLFPIIQVEAMFLTQTRLAVQDRHVFEHHLAVNTKV